MTISMALDEDRISKRKITKFNFYEEEDNKLRNNIKIDINKQNNSKLSKSAKKEEEK